MFPQAQLHSFNISSSPYPALSSAGGMWGLWSVHSDSSLLLLSHAFPLLWHGLSHGLQGTICSGAWSFSFSSLDLGVPSAVSYAFCSLLFFLSDIFWPFFRKLTQVWQQLGWWDQLCPMLGLCLTQDSPDLFSKQPSLLTKQSPCYQNLNQSQYSTHLNFVPQNETYIQTQRLPTSQTPYFSSDPESKSLYPGNIEDKKCNTWR